MAGTDYCVGIGPRLGVNGRPLRIQDCRRNGAPGQRIFIIDDNHIALQNGPSQYADVALVQRSERMSDYNLVSIKKSSFVRLPHVPSHLLRQV